MGDDEMAEFLRFQEEMKALEASSSSSAASGGGDEEKKVIIESEISKAPEPVTSSVIEKGPQPVSVISKGPQPPGKPEADTAAAKQYPGVTSRPAGVTPRPPPPPGAHQPHSQSNHYPHMHQHQHHPSHPHSAHGTMRGGYDPTAAAAAGGGARGGGGGGTGAYPGAYGMGFTGGVAASNTGSAAGAGGGSQPKKKRKFRAAGGKVWVDNSLDDWPEDDYRIFVGDLGNEVTDGILAATFDSYKSFAKAKVIRDKHNRKSKGFGFVSFLDPFEMLKALKEMNGKYCGNRPMKLRKSTWKERNVKAGKRKVKKLLKNQVRMCSQCRCRWLPELSSLFSHS